MEAIATEEVEAAAAAMAIEEVEAAEAAIAAATKEVDRGNNSSSNHVQKRWRQQ